MFILKHKVMVSEESEHSMSPRMSHNVNSELLQCPRKLLFKIFSLNSLLLETGRFKFCSLTSSLPFQCCLSQWVGNGFWLKAVLFGHLN